MGEDGEEDKTNKADNDEKYQKCKDKNSFYSLYIIIIDIASNLKFIS